MLSEYVQCEADRHWLNILDQADMNCVKNEVNFNRQSVFVTLH